MAKTPARVECHNGSYAWGADVLVKGCKEGGGGGRKDGVGGKCVCVCVGGGVYVCLCVVLSPCIVLRARSDTTHMPSKTAPLSSMDTETAAGSNTHVVTEWCWCSPLRLKVAERRVDQEETGHERECKYRGDFSSTVQTPDTKISATPADSQSALHCLQS